jgi:hypothetical protein
MLKVLSSGKMKEKNFTTDDLEKAQALSMQL